MISDLNTSEVTQSSPSQHAYFASALTGRSAWWHWLLGIAFVMGLFFAGTFLLASMVFSIPASRSDQLLLPGLQSNELAMYILLIASFAPLFAGLFLVQKYWHKRPMRALLTSASKFRWAYLVRAMIATVVVYILLLPLGYWLDPEEFRTITFISDIRVFLIGLGLTLLFIPIQAAAEEIGVRGYLNQALTKYVKYPWIAFFMTSLFFAWLHAKNPEAEGQFFAYMIGVFGFGILMCVILYLEGGLESAIGIHVANNIFAFSLFGYEDPDLPEIALWSSGPPDISIVDGLMECLFAAIVVAVTLYWNRRAAAKQLSL